MAGEYLTSGLGRAHDMPIAIVTGANSGIGRGTAVALARRGFDLGLTWHSDEENLREVVAECEAEGVRVEHRQVDLSAVPGPDAVVDELADALGGLDALVANAAAGHSTPFLELELEEFEWVIRFALTAQFLLGQRAARRMVDQGRGGRIVFVTSIHELVPLETATAYTAAKHGTGGLMKVMALELAKHRITVNSVAPGEIATKMTGNEDTDPESEERKGVPLGRPGDANEIGAAAAFLASEEASYITGETLVVDGGMNLMAAMANQLAS
jgi:NAD(P)-dependent dehydrogenase (short-subunit alcohol dehydrogenase family)